MINEQSEPQDIDSLSFEDAMLQLEKIVRQLESGQVNLEDSIKLYERGAKLRNICEETLKKAEMKVEKIMNNNPDETAPFQEK